MYHIPKQKKFTLEDMGASVSVYPPLGQVTQVQKENIQVTALLEVPTDQAQQSWEVALWHSTGGSQDEWVETPLLPTEKTPSTLQNIDSSVSRSWFSGQLSVQSLINFTVKFRSGSDQEWRWSRDEQGFSDGTIVVNTTTTTSALPDDFSEILQGYDSGISVRSTQSQCPGTRLWTIETHVEPAKGDDSTFTDVTLGVPWGGFLRYAGNSSPLAYPLWDILPCDVLSERVHWEILPMSFLMLNLLSSSLSQNGWLTRSDGSPLSGFGPHGWHPGTENPNLSWIRMPSWLPS